MPGDFDFSDVVAFSRELGDVPRETIPKIRQGVEFAARAAKDEWAKGAKRTGLRGYAASVDYDLDLNTDGAISAEIGPNLGKNQGSFGFVEDAPGDVVSAPQHAGRKAAKVAEKELLIGIVKAVGDL